MTPNPPPTTIQWLIDIRPHLPPPSTLPPKHQTAALFAPSTLPSRALLLLPPQTRSKPPSFIFPTDALMSLTSHLLKHHLITHLTSLHPPHHISPSPFQKPIYLSPTTTTTQKPFDFNVSHQAGLINISAVNSETADVGTDITCVAERIQRVYKSIEEEGFGAWIDIHAEVFHEREVEDMKYNVNELNLRLDERKISGYTRDKIYRCLDFGAELGQGVSAKEVIDAKLRRFYAFWALREAYVKMTGEALLANWLRDLEFRKVRTPIARSGDAEVGLEYGEVVRDVEVWFRNKRVTNVKVELRAVGRDYMIADCVRDSRIDVRKLELREYEQLDLRDIVAEMESNKQ